MPDLVAPDYAVARLLLEGIDENAVDFRDTYNGEDEEPIVLPAWDPMGALAG